jgi:hypothetical protein
MGRPVEDVGLPDGDFTVHSGDDDFSDEIKAAAGV